MTTRSLEEAARTIFGSDDPDSVRRWVEYWKGSGERNRELLRSFETLVPLDFKRRSVLDIGCGTGGMVDIIGHQCQLYVGADYHEHVLQFAHQTHDGYFLRCDGTELPFPDESFDYVFAFDVIEHLVGGEAWQNTFLQELRRVLRPAGMILLTTPNWWYPIDGHSKLFGPQYLPVTVADLYLKWLNPGFLKEHNSFAEIQLMSPRRLKRCLKKSGLRFLHDLPNSLDKPDCLRLAPLRGLLAYLGLGWYPHAEFWGILVREESRTSLRPKMRGSWHFEESQPSDQVLPDFEPGIDFDIGPYNPQLGQGWFWYERDERGFRWTQQTATCYLESRSQVSTLRLSGLSPTENHLEVRVDGHLVGESDLSDNRGFSLEYLIPVSSKRGRVFQIDLKCRHTFRPEDQADQRQLGIMVFSIGLSK
jgi:SAM-dependent methyltransferase